MSVVDELLFQAHEWIQEVWRGCYDQYSNQTDSADSVIYSRKKLLAKKEILPSY